MPFLSGEGNLTTKGIVGLGSDNLLHSLVARYRIVSDVLAQEVYPYENIHVVYQLLRSVVHAPIIFEVIPNHHVWDWLQQPGFLINHMRAHKQHIADSLMDVCNRTDIRDERIWYDHGSLTTFTVFYLLHRLRVVIAFERNMVDTPSLTRVDNAFDRAIGSIRGAIFDG